MHLRQIIYAFCMADVLPIIAEVLERGKTNTVQLSNHMLEGRDSWLKWHRYYAQTLSPKIEQVCLTAKPLLIRLMSCREATLYTERLAVSSSLNRLIQVPQDWTTSWEHLPPKNKSGRF